MKEVGAVGHHSRRLPGLCEKDNNAPREKVWFEFLLQRMKWEFPEQ